ncbi:MAG: type IV conjugative transfer system protein TraE [Alphaproteobacteria bacterium]|jgi:conjugal transfer pilus assembly protein TraE|nr:type IV conjugative transfer system protein TraE [Alphaproteobacteria bacterium]MBT5389494.1 type IV conjugative transfer system protein TraE [Alphaproteobacteria bacterium]MBT5540487.1 type IV conjugative transfer system protein TraE [Alphaproteobacteria bacterium]MBT5654499.1 type IV conjugative transfer system protein TraE [Alphaproteobacteria bacterium]
MKLLFFNGRLKDLVGQRNLLLSFSLSLLLLNFIQSISTLTKNERIVVVPPEVRREYWFEKNRVSRTYLEEMTLFFADLLLEMSPESAPFKREIILRNTSSSSYGTLKSQLLEGEERLKKEHVTTAFHANSVTVHPDKLTAIVTGDLAQFVGEKRVSQSRDTYEFQFSYKLGRLLIESFKLLKGE